MSITVTRHATSLKQRPIQIGELDRFGPHHFARGIVRTDHGGAISSGRRTGPNDHDVARFDRLHHGLQPLRVVFRVRIACRQVEHDDVPRSSFQPPLERVCDVADIGRRLVGTEKIYLVLPAFLQPLGHAR